MKKFYNVALLETGEGKVLILNGIRFPDGEIFGSWEGDKLYGIEKESYKLKSFFSTTNRKLYWKALLKARVYEYWAYEKQVNDHLDYLIEEKFPIEVINDTEKAYREYQEIMCTSIGRLCKRVRNIVDSEYPMDAFLRYCVNSYEETLNDRKTTIGDDHRDALN